VAAPTTTETIGHADPLADDRAGRNPAAATIADHDAFPVVSAT
jgi:hypothetical protein